MTATEPDVKEKILSAAKKQFALQGYDGTTVRRICEDAGVNIALVSYHFGGKEQLFQSLFDGFPPEDKMALLEQMLDNPVKGLRYIIQEITLIRMNDPELMNILQQEIQQESPRVPFIRDRLFPFWGKVHQMIRIGQQKGIFRIRSHDSAFMFLIGAILFYQKSGYFQPLLTEEPRTVDQITQDTIQFVFRGLGAPDLAEVTT